MAKQNSTDRELIEQELDIMRRSMENESNRNQPKLTFSQLLQLITVVILLMASWIDLNVKIERIDVKYNERTEFLEKGRVANQKLIENEVVLNRIAHEKISEKLDILIGQKRK
jgi:hypothetical protein